MKGNTVIPVALPSGVEPTREDLELLEAAVRRLESEGWSVSFRQGWIAEARRGHESEQAFGATRAEALAELTTLTALDGVAGYSS